MSINVSSFSCPECGHVVDTTPLPAALQHFARSAPEAGAVYICGGCAGAMQFQEDLSLAPMSDDAIAALEPENAAELMQMQLVVMDVIARKKAGVSR